MNFYHKPLEHEPYIESTARAFLAETGARIMSYNEANERVPVSLFRNYEVQGGTLAIPNNDRVNTPIPFEPMDHEYQFVFGSSLKEILERFIRENFVGRKFLFSASPGILLPIELEDFSYELLRNLYTGNLSTPIIVFDEQLLHAVFFEHDLAVNTVSLDFSCEDELIGGKDRNFWVKFFNRNFAEGISYESYGIELVKKYYTNSIIGLEIG